MNHYAQAIGILTHGSIDSYKIAVKLAQTNPALFCKLATDDTPTIVSNDKFTAFERTIIDVARLRKVEAIKMYRERFGCGLKEAFDAVNALQGRA